jgi:hypothetical protein
VSLDRTVRDTEYVGRFLARETYEKAELNNLCNIRMFRSELFEGFIQGQEAFSIIDRGNVDVIYIHSLTGTAVLEPSMASCPLDQYAPHRLSGGGKKVAAAVPELRLVRLHKPQVGFVDKRRGLKRLPRLFVRQLLCCYLAQLVIDQRQELLSGVQIALLEGRQDAGDVGHQRRG